MKERTNRQKEAQTDRVTMRTYISSYNNLKAHREDVWGKILELNPTLARYPRFQTEYAERLYKRYCEAYDHLQGQMDAIANLPITVHAENTAGA